MNETLKEPRVTLNQWLSWLESLHPTEIDLGLDRTIQVAERLKLRDFGRKFGTNVVTVAGTNGKGSSIAALEAIYTDAGYRVGAYTSPHLIYYNERVRLNGKPVSDSALIQAFEAVDAARQGISLTYFEFGTLAALYLFKHPELVSVKNHQPLDIILLEVGLGGRLDAVNIIDADVALITSIGIDHQAWLGDTREDIGFEKAGIMRQDQDVVIGESETPNSTLAHAKKLGLTPYIQGQHFGIQSHYTGKGWSWYGLDKTANKTLMNQLPEGTLLLDNLAAVLQVCQLVPLPLHRDHIEKGLTIELEGRQECVGSSPVYIFDVAHNADAVLKLAKYLKLNPVSGKTYAVFGMLADKNVSEILPPLQPFVDHWITSALPVQRSFSRDDIAETITHLNFNLRGSFSSPEEAYKFALSLVCEDDRILIFGSFYTVSAVKQAMLKQSY